MMPTRLPADHRAQKLRRVPALPAASPQHPLALARPPRGHQDQRQRHIRRGFGHRTRGIAYRHACRFGRRDVDMVVADAEIGDQPGARRHAGKDLGRKAVAQRRQHRIVIGQRRAQLGLGQGQLRGPRQRHLEARSRRLHDLVRQGSRDQAASSEQLPAQRHILTVARSAPPRPQHPARPAPAPRTTPGRSGAAESSPPPAPAARPASRAYNAP